VLLRARAIEAGLFIVAAAQSGHHEDGRNTYGHSLVVDPWGEVLLDMEEGPAWPCEIDLSRITDVRSRVPALSHRRPIDKQWPVIVFDLKCSEACAVFERWFSSSDDFASRPSAGLSSAPIAGRRRSKRRRWRRA
jgi:hypothetical protein